MKNNKKVLVLVLSLVLVCSMLFGLVACNDTENVPVDEEYATIIFKANLDAEEKAFRVSTYDMLEGYTVEDLFLSDTDKRYGFKANMTLQEWGYMLNSITGSKIDPLVPDPKTSFVACYSTSEADKYGEEAKSKDFNGVTYYESNGVNKLKLTAGVSYLFVVQTF